jgi:hypothetical protein
MEFLSLNAMGKTYSEIAAECYVSRPTVDKTIVSARERLGAKNVQQAIVRAIALELLILDADGNVSVPESFNYLFNPAGGVRRVAVS